MFTKYIGFKINIPEEFKEKEDVFMTQLLLQIGHTNTDYIYFHPDVKKVIKMRMGDIFTKDYEFVDTPKGF